MATGLPDAALAHTAPFQIIESELSLTDITNKCVSNSLSDYGDASAANEAAAASDASAANEAVAAKDTGAAIKTDATKGAFAAKDAFATKEAFTKADTANTVAAAALARRPLREAAMLTSHFDEELRVLSLTPTLEMWQFLTEHCGCHGVDAAALLERGVGALDELYDRLTERDLAAALKSIGLDLGQVEAVSAAALVGPAVDAWRSANGARYRQHFLTLGAIDVVVLKVSPDGRSWRLRRARFTQGMFIYTTLGRAGFDPSTKALTPIYPPRGAAGVGRQFQLRGRWRVAADAVATPLGAVASGFRGTRGPLATAFRSGTRVHGVDFAPQPSQRGGRVFRIYVRGEDDLARLTLAIKHSAAYAATAFGGGVSPEAERIAAPGLGGQLSGFLCGEDIRGASRPAAGTEAQYFDDAAARFASAQHEAALGRDAVAAGCAEDGGAAVIPGVLPGRPAWFSPSRQWEKMARPAGQSCQTFRQPRRQENGASFGDSDSDRESVSV